MKNLIPVLFAALLCATCAAAQTPETADGPPAVTVVKKSWRENTHSPALDTDPFAANDEFNESLRQQRISDIQNAIRAKGSESREPTPPPAKKTNNEPSKPLTEYVYSAKIRNGGPKAIRLVDWAYLFFDPDTQAELGRHRYSSKVKIGPGRDGELIGRSPGAQTYTVSAKNAAKGMGEKIVIYRVEYEDGSAWVNAAK